uniref:NAD-dependent epimerase/dehydratase n=1 Tax=Tetraselmis sp. GSL018 TaxID=582737 RepID=A0A061QUY2_9CHLO|mmetsp:Transcript_13080/g.31008  ORF Transcript_13080/g.31008 Transcript_13080/m.31008 type:complete len:297 (-) Transcript_13080:126-1016(-)|eukprot:CAMPEP_0177615966 /NCGR_PEP_ID=MMETSP0419_2-20121207/23827_1 /TAXON_ID=582737 /ORGANISM="Tetraselmis sp., Strain GSL018" /LENGTH=296 /DNA_ID=CAMNT_0019113839 /DNA_START=66 /DNA_END=956 /DNA_ORIENTATION=+
MQSLAVQHQFRGSRAASFQTEQRLRFSGLSSARSALAGTRVCYSARPRSRPSMASQRLQVSPRAQGDRLELDPDNASILVCGGGGVALEVTRKLKDMGSWVWMLQRTEERRKEIEGMMAIVSNGDALNKEDVEKVFTDIDEVDAVISTIGGTTANPLADSEGNINVIEAALKKGVRKFVLVTSIGCGESRDATPAEVYETLKPVLVEKEKAEARLMENGDKMTFVIIRPGGLKSDDATGTAVLTESTGVIGTVTRKDVAALTVKALFSDKANNKVLSCVDQNGLFESSKDFEVFEL